MIHGFVENDCVVTRHNHGFFSCCSVILHNIVEYIHLNKKLPLSDSSKSFEWYKSENRDITYDYFEQYQENHDHLQSIDYKESYQFIDYSNLDYNITSIVNKYFSPSIITFVFYFIEEMIKLQRHNYVIIMII